VVRALTKDGHDARVMSRGARGRQTPEGVEWARADLLTGEGLGAAAFRAGKNTAPRGERGVTSWGEWLARRGTTGAV
jgi:hypothetical protein